MITSISLRNFQSWKKLDIDIAPITMFVGRGDAGKSAIKRAVTYSLQNKGGDGFIRLGEDACKVGITFDNASLLWTKKRGKGAVYHVIIDGEELEYNKTGQTTPQEIIDLFQFRGIEVDKNTVLWPQLQGQHDTPYIIGESGSKVARILGKFTKLDVLVQAQMLARRDAEACRKTAHLAEEQAAAAEQSLSELPNVEALKEAYGGLCRREADLDSQTVDLQEAEAAIQAYRHAKACRNPGSVANDAQSARALVGAVGNAEAALGDFRSAVSRLADAGHDVDGATERVEELRAEYETVCQEAGICESCPWKTS